MLIKFVDKKLIETFWLVNNVRIALFFYIILIILTHASYYYEKVKLKKNLSCDKYIYIYVRLKKKSK